MCFKALQRCWLSSAQLMERGLCQAGGFLQRLWPQTSLRCSAGPEHRSPTPHSQRVPQPPEPHIQHPGSKTRQRRGTYVCDGPSVGDG